MANSSLRNSIDNDASRLLSSKPDFNTLDDVILTDEECKDYNTIKNLNKVTQLKSDVNQEPTP